MSTTIRGLLLCAMLALLIAPASFARAQEGEVDVGYFYEQLEPYGRWIEHSRWGDVWSPDADSDWRPYTQGYWSYTEEHGWYWVSDEPFGWAVFHYGRWVLDESDGWLWIPGTEWAPAWVTWRADDGDDGFVGWAPLPPESDWGPDGDLVYDESYYDGPHFASMWIFVRPIYMTVPGMYRYAAPRPQNVIILRRSKHLRAYRKFDRRVFNAGLELRRFERLVGRPVPMMRLRSISSPRDQDFRDRPRGSDIPVFRPNIIEPRDGQRRRPTFKLDRPPGERVPYVRRAPDGRGTGPDGPGDLGRGSDGPRDRGRGPDFQDDRAKKGPGGPGDRGTGRDGPGDLGRGPDGPGDRKGIDGKDDRGRKGPGGPGDRAKAPEGAGPKGGAKLLPPADVGKEPRYKGPPQTTNTPFSKDTSPTFKAPSSGTTQPAIKSPPQQPAAKVVPKEPRPAPERTTKSPDKPDKPDKKDDKKDDKKGPGEPK